LLDFLPRFQWFRVRLFRGSFFFLFVLWLALRWPSSPLKIESGTRRRVVVRLRLIYHWFSLILIRLLHVVSWREFSGDIVGRVAEILCLPVAPSSEPFRHCSPILPVDVGAIAHIYITDDDLFTDVFDSIADAMSQQSNTIASHFDVIALRCYKFDFHQVLPLGFAFWCPRIHETCTHDRTAPTRASAHYIIGLLF